MRAWRIGVLASLALSQCLDLAQARDPAECARRFTRLRMISHDVGIGQLKEIRTAIRDLKGQAQLREYQALSNRLPVLRPRVEMFRSQGEIPRDASGAHLISPEHIADYLHALGRGTLEVLYVPGSRIPHLPQSVGQVGHVAIRIGGMVYHQTGQSGFREESLQSFLYVTKKNLRVYGTVLKISAREEALAKRLFATMREKQIPYSFLLNNCAQTACRALDLLQIRGLTQAKAIDPLLTHKLARKSGRQIMQNIYNVDKDRPDRAVALDTLKNRMFVYGLPVAAPSLPLIGVETLEALFNFLSSPTSAAGGGGGSSGSRTGG